MKNGFVTRLAALASVASIALSVPAGAAPFTSCAAPSRDGTVTVSGNATINSYYPGNGSANTGSTSISIGAVDSRGVVTGIQAGDLLLVMQVQGASLNNTNSSAYGGNNGTGRGGISLILAGNYEYVTAANSVGTGGGTLNLRAPLQNSYLDAEPGTGTFGTQDGRRRYQIIKVRQYRSLTLSGTITAPIWNGETGGAVVADVAGNLTMNGGSINVTGKGFRGGGGNNATSGNAFGFFSPPDYATNPTTNAAHGSKGESVSGTPYRTFDGTTVTVNAVTGMPGRYSNARGAPANGGGGGTDGAPTTNEQNAGGGGGSNGGLGGQGGYAWCTAYNNTNGCAQTGGGGGVILGGGGRTRMFFGGGGGAGSINNNTGLGGNGAGASGMPGGGAILMRVGSASGTGSLIADGFTRTTGVTNDATGGGGGGGTIQYFVRGDSSILTASAQGGNGISNSGGGSSHGPGGGGGGGYIVSNVPLSADVSPGSAGTTFPSNAYGANYGATDGTPGTVDTSYPSDSIPGTAYSGADCSPIITKAFSPNTIPVNGSSRLTVTIENPNPTLAMSNLAASDSYPTGLLNTASPAGATSCTSATITAAANSNSSSIANGALAANATCTFSANVTAANGGTYNNIIPAGNVTASIGGGTASASADATASLTVTPGLTISKSVTTAYDPINGFTNPKSIPGSYVQYSLTVTNPSNLAINADTVFLSDAIPANTTLVVQPVYSQLNYPGARGPFQYLDGRRADGTTGPTSGLTFTYVSPSSTTDSPSFSNNQGGTFTYVPNVSNPSDPSATNVRFQMFGTMAPNSSFTVNFLVQIQ